MLYCFNIFTQNMEFKQRYNFGGHLEFCRPYLILILTLPLLFKAQRNYVQVWKLSIRSYNLDSYYSSFIQNFKYGCHLEFLELIFNFHGLNKT